MNRRNFLKLGAASSAALTATSLTATLTGCTQAVSNNGQWKVLRLDDIVFLKAVIPVVLKGSLPSDDKLRKEAIENSLGYIDIAIFNLGPHNAAQMIDLFNLLNMRISRGLTTGVWSKWENASEEEIENFLNSWRESSVSLFNLAYNGINKLMCATWFGQPLAWDKVGYHLPATANLLITKNNNA